MTTDRPMTWDELAKENATLKGEVETLKSLEQATLKDYQDAMARVAELEKHKDIVRNHIELQEMYDSVISEAIAPAEFAKLQVERDALRQRVAELEGLVKESELARRDTSAHWANACVERNALRKALEEIIKYCSDGGQHVITVKRIATEALKERE